MRSRVFTQFRKVNEPRSKPVVRRGDPLPHNMNLKKPGMHSMQFGQHGILNCGKRNLIGWKLYGRK